MQRLNRLLWRITLGGCFVLLLLGTLYLSAGRLLVPMLNAYRVDIQDWLGSQLGQPLHLGRLHAGWHGLSPRFYAEDVRLGDGQQPLYIGRLHFRPDMLGSLLRGNWALSAISLQGLELDVQQQGGQWLVNGMPTDSGSGASEASLEQLLAAVQRIGHLGLVDAHIRIQPEQGAPLELRQAGFVLEQKGRNRQLQASLLLPDGQPLALSIQAQGRAAQWQQGSLRAYISVPASNWLQWLPASWLAVLPDSLSLDSSAVPLQAWVNVEQGRLRQLIVEVAGGQLSGRWQDQPLALEFGRILARYSEDARQRQLWLPELNVRWQPQGSMQNLAMQLRQDARGPADSTAIELALAQLQLEPLMAAVLQLVPMPALAKDILQQLDFRGQLYNTRLRWTPGLPWQHQLEYDTNIRSLDYSPWEDVPGATGIHGRLFGSLAGGELHLDSPGFSLYLRELFAEAWHYQRARARLTWSLNDNLDFELTSPYLQVRGDEGDLAGDFVIAIPQTAGAESFMDLRVGMRDGDALHKGKYLPLVLRDQQQALWDWLHAAIRGGDIHQGYFQYQGSLAANAPAAARSISLFFDVSNAELAWQPGWPPLRDGRSRVFVHDHGIEVEIDSARILDTAVGASRAEVLYPQTGASVLHIDTELDSSLSDALLMVQQTPLAQQLPQLARWQGQGRLPGRLQLTVPFDHQPVRVQLDMQLEGNSLQMPEFGVRLEQLRGPLALDSQRGLTSAGLSGRFLGQPFTASLQPLADSQDWSARVRAKGRMPVASLQRWLELPQPVPLSGTFDYQLDLGVLERGSQLQLDTDLQGVAIDLPPPLAKRAQTRVPTQWHMTLDGPELQYRLRHGERLNGLFAVAQTPKQTLRGELVLDARPARLPAQAGLRIRGQLAELPLPQWLTALERYASGAASQGAGVVQSIVLEAGELQGYGIPLEQARLDIRPEAGGWRAALDSQQATGVVQVPARGPLQVGFERLQLPATTEGTGAGLEPTDMPAMQVRIQQLAMGDEVLGGLAFASQPDPQGVNLTAIQADLKGLQVQGSMRWQGGTPARSSFVGELQGEQLEQVLQAWDYAPAMTGESFAVELDLGWPGTPADFSLEQLSGKATVKLRKGQLRTLDGSAQALRVFGLLNFDSIGRRLRLDFSDLWSKGLSYDRIDGLLGIDKGVYRTLEPLTLEGVSSNLNLNGSLDLPNGTVDALMQLEIPLSRNLPLAAIAVGAPAVGGALFVIDRLAGDRFARMAAVRYRITGDWENPDITLSKGESQ